MSWHRWIVAAASRLVPRALRTEWRAEWDAELRHRETVHDRWVLRPARSRLDLLRRSAGAFADAWWLRTNSWSFYRVFRQHWRLVTPAVLALATAVAAVVVGLAAYNALLWRFPGAADPGSLRFINAGPPLHPLAGISRDDYGFYRDHLDAFSEIAAFETTWEAGIRLMAGNYQERVTAGTCSPNLFGVLGVVPAGGRLAFDPPGPGGTGEIIVSSALSRRLGTMAGEVGATVELDGRPATIVGVLPASFRGIQWDASPDLWRPIAPQPAARGGWSRPTPPVQMIGRLAPGVTAAQAIAALRLASAALERGTSGQPGTRAAVLNTVSLTPPVARGEMAATLGGLLLATLLALLVACANTTNLLLALAAARREEMLVRVALGASRTQLVVPHLWEGAWLGLVSGLLGYGAAALGLARLSAVRLSEGHLWPPFTIPDVHADLRVLVATLVVAVLAGAAAGIAPALRAAADGFSGAISRELGIERARKARGRSTLVIGQMAVGVLVLAGVGMSVESLVNVRRAPFAFSPAGPRLLFADLNLTGITGSEPATIQARARERLATTPGIEAASLASAPLSARDGRFTITPAEAGPSAPGGIATSYTFVDDQYFATVKIPVIEGRSFDPADQAGTPEVAVVNATLAMRIWPGTTAVNRRLWLTDRGGKRLVEVVGVAFDTKYTSPLESQQPFVYLALAQHPHRDVSLILRTSPTFVAAPRSLVRQALSSVDPAIRASTLDIVTLDDMLAPALMPPRVVVAIVVTLGVMTLVLALLGLYGTVCYSVAQRRPEIGVRVALGAGPGNLFAIVLRHTGAVALAGAGLGLIAARIVLPAVSLFFYGVRAVDADVMSLVVVMSLAIALATAYAVARPWIRLTAVDLLRPR
jgi:putative ABC transport system permease protein